MLHTFSACILCGDVYIVLANNWQMAYFGWNQRSLEPRSYKNWQIYRRIKCSNNSFYLRLYYENIYKENSNTKKIERKKK